MSGFPVYDSTFRPDVHIAKEPLTAIKSPNYPLIVGLDFGRTPAAVIGQETPLGRTQVLAELCATNESMDVFAPKLRQLLTRRFPGHTVLVAPDPAGWAFQQGESKRPVDYLVSQGFKVVKPQTNDPNQRIQAVEAVLKGSVAGRAQFVVDPECTTLIRGFRGGYKWAMTKDGEMGNELSPVKNHPFSDVHDCLGYLVLVMNTGQLGKVIGSPARSIVLADAAGWS